MIKRAYILSLVSLILLSTFAFAAGSSSAGIRNSDTPSSTSTDSTIETCEDKTNLRERIKCRFDNPSVAYKEAYSAIEEACRNSEREQACQNLYKASAKCYDEDNAVMKKRCFLSEAGINFNAQGTFRAAPQEAKRNYVVLLLYELQERIEKMQEEGKITTEQATSLVAKIVEIKRMILAGNARADIVVKMQEFKQEYRQVMEGTQ